MFAYSLPLRRLALLALFLYPIFSTAQKTFEELKTEFEIAYAHSGGRSEMLRYSLTDGSQQQYYYMNWNLTGAISAWQATGNIAYFNDAKQVVDNTISKTKTININGESYLGWPEPNHTNGFELWDSMYWKEVATLLRIMHQSPSFIGPHRTWFYSVLDFTEKNIWERYVAKGEDGNQYGYAADDTSHWARIAMELYVITGKQKYKTFFDNVSFKGCTCPETMKGHSIRDQIFDNNSVTPTASNISWTWGKTTSGEVPDAPHVSAVVQFIALAAENRMYWNQGSNSDDIEKWVSTFDNVVWTDNSPAKGSFYIDGTGTKDSYALSVGAQAILGRFDTDFQVRMENNILDHVWNKSMIAGLLLLNRKILNDGAPVYPENYNNPDIGETEEEETTGNETEEEGETTETDTEEEEGTEGETEEETAEIQEEEESSETEEENTVNETEEEESTESETEEETTEIQEEEESTETETEEENTENETEEETTEIQEEEESTQNETEEETAENDTEEEESVETEEEENTEEETTETNTENSTTEQDESTETEIEEEDNTTEVEEESIDTEEENTEVESTEMEEETSPSTEDVENTSPTEETTEEETPTETEETTIVEDGVFGPLSESENKEEVRKLTAYPNPTNGDFTVSLPVESKRSTYELFSINGALIERGVIPDGQIQMQMEIDNGQKGLYILTINNFGGNKESLKVIKE